MAASATAPGSNLAAFNMLTHRNRRQLSDITGVTGFGQTFHADLLQTGYLSQVDILFFGTVNVTAQNAATANTMSPYWPWNLVSQIALRSNEGLELYRTRGYTNHVINSLRRGGLSALQPSMEAQTGNTPSSTPASPYAALGANSTLPTGFLNPYASARGNVVPLASSVLTAVGTNGATVGLALSPYATWTPGTATASTIEFCVHYRIPVAADPRLTTGSILMQNQATRIGLDLTTLNNTDWVLGTQGVNITTMTALSGTFRILQTFFSVPADPQAQPDTQFVHRWIEDQYPWTAGGDFQIMPPVNGIICRMLAELEINAGNTQAGTIVPYSASDGAGFQPASFSQVANRGSTGQNLANVQVSYAGSQFPEQLDYRFMAAENYYNYAQVLPDGFLMWDFDIGGGFPENGFSGRDVYDTSSLTQFQTIFNWTAATAPPAGSRVWAAREELQRRQ